MLLGSGAEGGVRATVGKPRGDGVWTCGPGGAIGVLLGSAAGDVGATVGTAIGAVVDWAASAAPPATLAFGRCVPHISQLCFASSLCMNPHEAHNHGLGEIGGGLGFATSRLYWGGAWLGSPRHKLLPPALPPPPTFALTLALALALTLT